MIVIEFYRSRSLLRSEKFRWRVVDNKNGKVLARSSEGYANVADCEEAAFKVCAVGPHAGRVAILKTSADWPE